MTVVIKIIDEVDATSQHIHSAEFRFGRRNRGHKQ